jgi:hypothetical protein
MVCRFPAAHPTRATPLGQPPRLGLLVRVRARFPASGEGAATRNEYKYIRRAASLDRVIKVTQEREFAVDGSDKDDKVAPR